MKNYIKNCGPQAELVCKNNDYLCYRTSSGTDKQVKV